jgi:ATP-dependent DNA helicase RecG
MKKKVITFEDAHGIMIKEESHFLDFKSFDVSGTKIQKVAVAFANADGGEFLIGIKDLKDEPRIRHRWNGGNKIEDFNPHLQALSEITPTLDFSITFLECEKLPGSVMQVFIEKGSTVHETASKEVYLRKGAQSLKITDNKRIAELRFAKGAVSFEDSLLPNVEPEIIFESNELSSFLKEFSPKTDSLEYMVNENIIDSKSFTPRVAGVLLFADNPSANLPKKCAVKIARYETREEEAERDYLKEIFTIEGPLYNVIFKSIEKIQEIMSSIKIYTAEGRKNVNYPPEAIWEIVTNAIIHRDYNISDDVHIHIFNNRIEVLSPGKLPGYVTIENILDARFTRNHKIVRTLNRYKNAPNKDMGEGLNTAFEKMKEWRLKPPIIEEHGNYVKVTIPHVSLESASEQILTFLSSNDTINNKQAREITGIKSENLVKIEFYKLRDEGLIERVPGKKGPAAAWRLKK